jgi:hypothetical protein
VPGHMALRQRLGDEIGEIDRHQFGLWRMENAGSLPYRRCSDIVVLGFAIGDLTNGNDIQFWEESHQTALRLGSRTSPIGAALAPVSDGPCAAFLPRWVPKLT